MKLRKLTGGILICMIFAAAILNAAGAAEAETTTTTEETTTAAPIEEETTAADPDFEAENLYARRMQYAQDIMLQDAYNLRLQYSSEVSEQYSVRNKVVEYALSFVGVTPYVPGQGVSGGIDDIDHDGFSGIIFLLSAVKAGTIFF